MSPWRNSKFFMPFFLALRLHKYAVLTEFAPIFQAAMQTLAKGLGDKREIKAKIVRQTGKIRAKLMTQASSLSLLVIALVHF